TATTASAPAAHHHGASDTVLSIGGGGNSSMPVTGRAASAFGSATVDETSTENPSGVTSCPFTFTGANVTGSDSPRTNGSSRYTWAHRSLPPASGVTAAGPAGRIFQSRSVSGARSCLGNSMTSGAGPSNASVTRIDSESRILALSGVAVAVTDWAE